MANRTLDKDVPVQPDGGIAFPLVGNLNARGMTLKELQGKIADNLRESQYFPNLTDNEVTVSMVKATGNSVSVVGQVKAPGTVCVRYAARRDAGLEPRRRADTVRQQE